MKKSIIISVIVLLIVTVISTLVFMNMNQNKTSNNGEIEGVSITTTTVQLIRTLSVEDFRKALENKDAIIIDVRTSDEYNSGHIDGAVNIDFYGNFSSEISKLDKSKTYLIYCRSGNRSKAALGLFQSQGFTNVADVQGGITALGGI